MLLFFINISNTYSQNIVVTSGNKLFNLDLSSGDCSTKEIETFCNDAYFFSIALIKDTLYYFSSNTRLYMTVLRHPSSCRILRASSSSNALTADSDGNLYWISDRGDLIKYDPHTEKENNLGHVNYDSAGDLMFYRGKLYLASYALVEINLQNPAKSTVYMNTEGHAFFGLVNVPSGCNRNRVFGIEPNDGWYDLIEIDMEKKKIGKIFCSLPFQVLDAASITENGNHGGVNINSVNVSSDCIPGSYNKSIAINATTPSRSNISYVLNDSVTNSTGIFQNLGSGNYHIRVKTSAGCFADTIVAIKDAVPIVCNIDIMNDTCNSGSGSILVKQTTDYKPLTYSLNNGQFQSDSFFNKLFRGVYLLKIHDPNNCRIDTTVELSNINLNTPVSAIDILPEVCNNNRGKINIHFAGDIVVNEVSLNNAPFQTSGLFTGLKAGQYHIAISASKCRFDTIVNVPSLMPSKPELEISTSSPDCFDKLNGSIQVRNENNPFTISLNNSAFTDKYFYSNLVPGLYSISIKDSNNCIWDTAVTVPAFTVHKPVVNSIIKNPQCWQSLPGSIIINISGDESPYTFSVNGNTYNSGSEVSDLWPADYPVKILNRNDCVVDSLIIPLKQDNNANYNCDTAYVPTAFTPNHDGKNDILTPVIPGFFVQTITFNIYNRFGQLIFSTHELNDGWNGTCKGRPQSAGTYVWILQYSINNVSKMFRGTTVLIR